MKTNNLKMILGMLLILSLCQCKKKEEHINADEPHTSILKFKEGKDYSNNMWVGMDKNAENVALYPNCNYDSLDIRNKVFGKYNDLYKGYYLNLYQIGANTAYLNYTIKEYGNVCESISSSSIDEAVIDKNPFAEYYYDVNDCLLTSSVISDTLYKIRLDTAKFHRLVDNGELEKYLKRVK